MHLGSRGGGHEGHGRDDAGVGPRDLVIVFFADEEAGGTKGSHYVVDHRPDVFAGVTEAISEVGGYSVTVSDHDGMPRRAYLLQTAEKGIAWLQLTAQGRAGHGSVPNDDNAIVHLAEAVSRIAHHTWPREYIASVRSLLEGLSSLTGTPYADDDLDPLLSQLGGAAGFVRGTLCDTSNVTMFDAGYKQNVIPQHAQANVDCRFLPGHEDDLAPTTRRSRAWGSSATASRRCSCPPTSTSPRCSTASTNECPSTP